ncbi:MAG: phytanoyl-CoA dioxygenase family protein, partial [Pseudomonadota bacterium]
MSPDAYSDFFAEHGYLAVEELLQPAEINELRDDLVRLARGAYPCRSLEPLPADVSDAEALEQILCIHMPHFVSPTVKRFTVHPAIADILGRVVGAHLAPGFWDGSVKCMQSMFFAKPPGKPGQAWHQDECYI